MILHAMRRRIWRSGRVLKRAPGHNSRATLDFASFDADEEEEAPKEQKLLKMAVDTPLEDFFVEDPGAKLGQARMLRKKALALARQIRLRRTWGRRIGRRCRG